MTPLQGIEPLLQRAIDVSVDQRALDRTAKRRVDVAHQLIDAYLMPCHQSLLLLTVLFGAGSANCPKIQQMDPCER